MKNKFKTKLQEWEKTDQLRQLRPLSDRTGQYVTHNGKKLLNLSSNDYLGIATDANLLRQFYAEQTEENLINSYGIGSSSSRLMTATTTETTELETLIAERYNKDAILLNSGYHANIGILPALTDRKKLILADKLCHASIIDGLKLSNARFIRYRHLDYDHCQNIIEKEHSQYDEIFIISESIFSMDGDIADLQKLVKIKNDYNAMLYIDEAHAVGVRGDTGLGICEEQNVINEIDIIIGTFGKALASIGAYAAVSPTIKQYLINSMRSFIFTTALPPVVVNWNLHIFELIKNMQKERLHLQNLSDNLRAAINPVHPAYPCKYSCLGKGSQIIPIIVGSNENAISLGNKMIENGYLAQPIRPPTVPKGSARIRISLSAGMKKEDLADIPAIVNQAL